MLRRVVAILSLVLFALAGLGESVLAHAVLVNSAPANGAKLEKPPRLVVVLFSQPVEAGFTPLTVRDQSGARVDSGDAAVDKRRRNMVVASLPPLPGGQYIAEYRVTSLDGHPIAGRIAFAVGAAAPPEEMAATGSPAGTATWAVGAAHGAQLLLAVLLAGLAAFMLLVWRPVSGDAQKPPGLGRWAAVLTALFVAATLIDLALYAAGASGRPVSPELMGQVLHTRTGSFWLARTGLALAAGLALALSYRARSGLVLGMALAPGALLLLMGSLQSHAVATQRLAPLLADWAHMLAMALWAGGVVGFAAVVWPSLKERPDAERQEVLARAVPRFSRLAVGAVLLLMGTGLYSAVQQIPSWDALWVTAYGRLLLLKLALLVPLLGLGALNLASRGQGLFRRLLWGEVAIMAAIFMAAGFLSSQPPARVEIAAFRQAAFSQTATRGGLELTLRVEPARVGVTHPTILLKREGGEPEQGASVSLRATMTAHEMEMQTAAAPEQAAGLYRSEQLIFGMDGAWNLEVVVRTSQGREVRHTFAVIVPPAVAP